MRFQDWMSGRRAVQLGLWIGQHMPRWAGHGLSRLTADFVVRRRPEVYWTVRANLRQVVDVDGVVLDRMIHSVFEHAGQTYYDFFHAIGQPSNVLAESVRISPVLIERMRAEMDTGRGVLLLGVHMSNFDLALLALSARGLPAQILSLTGPHEGFELLNDLRRVDGVEVTPITPQSLRGAIRRLRQGGLVITGADRPVPQDQELIEFFGRPAYLPVGPARMALMTEAAVFLGACCREPQDEYVLDITGPIELSCTGDHQRDIRDGTRRLAMVMEKYVRAYPRQWMMFHRVWPKG